MVIINDKPMISHIMDIYLTNGYSEFVFALGYKGELIKRWVIDQQELNGNIFVDFEKDL
jgi:glucose-1-phosphate cytidylyltransferase